MSIPRVLVDLSLANAKMGFSGIPQDSRLLFDGLAHSEKLEVEGLISPLDTSWRGGPLDRLEEQAVFMGPFLNSANTTQWSIGLKLITQVSSLLGRGFERIVLNRRAGHELHELQKSLHDIAWRTFLSLAVDADRRQALMARRYFLSAVGRERVSDGALGRLPPVRLDTQGHDFIVFQDTRVISVSPGTTRIMRYHDGIPAFSSDTIPSPSSVRLHIRAVKQCAPDSIFVCNSPSAQHDLSQISTTAGENSRVIPYFVPRIGQVTEKDINLPQLALPRVSETTLGKDQATKVVANWFAPDNNGRAPEFIMALGTIEPRKNLRGLIAAWQRFRNATGKKTKLLVVGAPGWHYEPILREMQPFVSTGQLLHLERVSQDELRYWYSAARCFAFISFAEGFGLPPVEAMQCGCPVLVSDILAHRYSAGDAAIYCDPYSSNEIAAKLDFLTRDENRGEIDAMAARGHANADRFTIERVLPLWEELFSRPPNLSRARASRSPSRGPRNA